MVTALLGRAGYEVEHALSATDGLKLAKAGGFDLILLDWLFEDGTGIELCEQIRRLDAATPILFYSGISDENDIERALGAGAQGYLVKPAGGDELVEAVSTQIKAEPRPGE
jgi:OmpR-family two-component system manganese-sensing response regulator